MKSPIWLCVVAAGLMCVDLAIGAAEPTTAPDAPATQPTTLPVAINWDQAKSNVGKLAAVTGIVVGTHDFGDAAVLNIGKDFPDRDRFTTYISAEKRKDVPDDLYQGCTITVTGTIKLYRGVAEIEAGASDITVIKKAEAAPTTAP